MSADFASRDEYEKNVLDALDWVCRTRFHVSVPGSILQMITDLCCMIDTELLSLNEIEWIEQEVIPNKFLFERIYHVSDNIDADDIQKGTSFKKYDSYDFHDCVDEKGPTVFILHVEKQVLIGGYCDQSWFSPYKREKDSKGSNGGYWVKDSTDCKVFALRNEALTDHLQRNDPNGACLPLLVQTVNEKKNDMMVAANLDGPNFGFNAFYVTSQGALSGWNSYAHFKSPVDSIEGFFQFLTYEGRRRVTGMEVFSLTD